MDRRGVLKCMAAIAGSARLGGISGLGLPGDARAAPRAGGPDDLPDDVRITRVTGFPLDSERPKLVGRNSHLDVHGRKGSDFLWRIETSAGVEGLGAAPRDRDAAAAILGKNAKEFYRPRDRAMVSPVGRGDMPLWDLIAKLLGKPAYALFGGKGPVRVPVYDGSIYFSDLLPEYRDRGVARILAEIDEGISRGHRAFKVKVGRGWKWMPREQGDRRDIEVLHAIRKHVGPDIEIYIDANNGFDLAGTKRLFDAVGPLGIAFAEEMFPETVDDDLAFKAFLKDRGWRTRVADGESARAPGHFEGYIKARALDILQPDMKAFGFTLQLQMDRMLQGTGMRLAPHNWGSLVGYYMQLHLGRGIETFFRAEQDPLSSDVLVAEGYTVKDGSAVVPDAPGFGLSLDRDAFSRRIKPAWRVEAP